MIYFCRRACARQQPELKSRVLLVKAEFLFPYLQFSFLVSAQPCFCCPSVSGLIHIPHCSHVSSYHCGSIPSHPIPPHQLGASSCSQQGRTSHLAQVPVVIALPERANCREANGRSSCVQRTDQELGKNSLEVWQLFSLLQKFVSVPFFICVSFFFDSGCEELAEEWDESVTGRKCEPGKKCLPRCPLLFVARRISAQLVYFLPASLRCIV